MTQLPTHGFYAAGLLAADDERYRAMLAGDLDRLDALLAADLVYTHASSGGTDDKASYLAAMREGHIRYEHCERQSATIQWLGDVALMHGSLLLAAQLRGQPRQMLVRYLTVWTYAKQRWTLAAWSSTLVPGG
jgi:ketosteroid isomerase-like protein